MHQFNSLGHASFQRACLTFLLLLCASNSPAPAQNAGERIGGNAAARPAKTAVPAPSPRVATTPKAGLSPALQKAQKNLNERRRALTQQQQKLLLELRKLDAQQQELNIRGGVVPAASPTVAATPAPTAAPVQSNKTASPSSDLAPFAGIGVACALAGIGLGWLLGARGTRGAKPGSREEMPANARQTTVENPIEHARTRWNSAGDEVVVRALDVARLAVETDPEGNNGRKGRSKSSPLGSALQALEEETLARRGLGELASMNTGELRAALRLHQLATDSYRLSCGAAPADASQTARWLRAVPTELEKSKHAGKQLERANATIAEHENDIEALLKEVAQSQEQHELQLERLKTEAKRQFLALKGERDAALRAGSERESAFAEQLEAREGDLEAKWKSEMAKAAKRFTPLQQQNEAFITSSQQQIELERQSIKALRDLQTSSGDLALVAGVGFLMEHCLGILGRCVYLNSPELHQLAMKGLHTIASSFEGSLSSFAVLRASVEQLDPQVAGRTWKQATGHEQQSLFAGIVTTIREHQRDFGRFPRAFSFALLDEPGAATGTAFTAVGE